MIRRGKEEGWLYLPSSSLCPSDASSQRSFASTYGIDTKHASVATVPGRGSALLAKPNTDEVQHEPLLVVPKDLVLSKENAILLSKTDRHLRDVLKATKSTDLTATRHVILILLLVQATHDCPSIAERIGVPNPFADYIKFLPLELLPTFWTDDEMALLGGTTLQPAIEAKMKSLYREYDILREATMSIPWCQHYWWDEIDGLLAFDDWKQVDAMYRSRALEFPNIGDCMIPCIDMANHEAGEATVARYEADPDGNALLLLKEGKMLSANEEITITYGDDKGACEMLFSYGFLDQGMTDAQTLFLDIEIPDDDPLKQAKKYAAGSAPGVRVTMHNGELLWESDFVWLVVVNEEDGLDFQLLQTVDGKQELRMLWRKRTITEAAEIEADIRSDQVWPIYHLRAVSLVQDRVNQQLKVLRAAQVSQEQSSRLGLEDNVNVREGPKRLAAMLQGLELKLLDNAYEFFENEKSTLAATDTVQNYLLQMQLQNNGEEEEDFS